MLAWKLAWLALCSTAYATDDAATATCGTHHVGECTRDMREATMSNNLLTRNIIKNRLHLIPDAGNQGTEHRPLRTLVINLASRADRWETVSRELEQYTRTGALSVERLEATDGQKDRIPRTMVTHTWRSDLNAKFEQLLAAGLVFNMTGGERACSMSHIRAWQVAAKANEPVLIVEDDATFEKGFDESLFPKIASAEEAGADVLYLSYLRPSNAPWRQKLTGGLAEASYLWLTTGYVIWPSAAKKLLESLPVTDPADNYIARMTYNHMLLSFAVRPVLITPAQKRNKASDVVHSSDVWVSQKLQGYL